MSWTFPKCERELAKPNQWHYCAKISVASLFDGVPMELELAFDQVLAEVASWEDVAVSTTPNCIVFGHRKTFLVIRPTKKFLEVKFYTKEPLHEGTVAKTNLRAGKLEHQVRLLRAGDVNSQLFSYFRKSYELL
ncbi:hypothetical protein GS399_11075 [Pedobacter sp. HMF7647]|uniref:DUF5655 domain-containing protein n=1 Tax=Hufsiella arboris TaxID=2695275 RepID=A0A7K1YAC0_9SPHI|nr:DUF5655 domain-containing protein [Hufsiella arboris]MXV51513.1 hypothetical protein [Hufsiella arboris]